MNTSHLADRWPRLVAGGGIITAAVACALGAAPALADGGQTLSVQGACFVDQPGQKPAPIKVSGSGWTANDTLDLDSTDADGSLFGMVKVGADGTFKSTIPGTMIDPTGQPVETLSLKAHDPMDESAALSGKFQVTALAVATKPAYPNLGQKVTFTFSGFTPGKTVYAHYLLHGKSVATRSFGKAQGACGMLTAHGALFAAKHPKAGDYTIQYDTSKTYSKNVPHVDAKAAIIST